MTTTLHRRSRLSLLAGLASLMLAAAPLHAQTDPGSTSRGNQIRIEKDSAAGRVVQMVYEGRFSYVRIETREPGAPTNQHPVAITPAALRATLDQARLRNGNEALLTAKQLDEITAPLATALGRVTPEQEASFAVSDQFGYLGTLAAKSVTTGRVFQRDGQLNLIVGLLRYEFENQFRASGYLVPFEPGQRAKAVDRSAKLVVASGAGSSKRDDWLVLGLAAAPAVAAPASAPAVPAQPGAAPAATAASAATAPATPAPAPADADALYRATAERLKTLQRLRDSGLITEQEYQEKRKQILKDL